MTTAEISASYAEDLSVLEKLAPAAWLSQLRRRAFDRFGELGFPTLRDEEWKYTNVAPIRNAELRAADPGSSQSMSVAAGVLESLALGAEVEVAARLVFVDGHFREDLSSGVGAGSSGLIVKSLASAIVSDAKLLEESLATEASFEEKAFVALNTALFVDGVFVRVPRGVVVEKPIHVVFLTSGTGRAAYPRVLVLLEESAQARLVEEHAPISEDSPGGHAAGSDTSGRGARLGAFTNIVSEIFLGENASFEHDKIGIDSGSTAHVAQVAVRQARTSRYRSHHFALGGRLVRSDIDSRLDGEDVECTLNGLTIASGQQHVDNHTRIVHAMPNCRSWELYKAVLADRAHGVFNGKIFVAQDAQKTDAKQTNQSLLLSDHAVMDSKPELEIYADDVKCTHGATIGQLDDDALFYLRSRGVSASSARDLLTYAFASDVVEHVSIPELKRAIEKRIFEKLACSLDTSL